MTTVGGFLLASRGHINLWLGIATLAGASLVIASGCVFNNYLDRGIDAKMARTKKRALVNNVISTRSALLYATSLGLLGFLILSLYTNALTTLIGFIAFITYVVLYGIGKRRSVHGTLVGSIAGAAPPVAGYTAATGRFDGGALILLLIMICWQMPHFYAIAMYRFSDYKAAKIPVLPVVKGQRATKIQILLYSVAFIVATSLLTAFGYAGYSFGIVMAALGLAWLQFGIQGFKTVDDRQWGRKMFLFSLVVIMTFSIMLSLDSLLP